MAETEHALSTQVATPSARAVHCLGAVRELLDALHREEIPYCHWKSNEHLEAALLAATDLDVLVDRSRSLDLQRVLSEASFKRFAATTHGAYPAMEDYLGCDEETGRLIHLHLHYQLTVGKRHLKGFRLPWERVVLSTRLRDPSAETYVSAPNMEMLLLVVRGALKIRFRDRLRRLVGKGGPSDDLLREFFWLKERTDDDRVLAIGRQLLGPEAIPALKRILDDGPSLGRFSKLRRAAAARLSTYRTYGRVHGTLRRWRREVYWLLGAINARYVHLPVPFRRTVPTGGVMIALIGADGSGKSTVRTEILRWLRWKVWVQGAYFGSGEGTSSWLRWPLRTVLRMFPRTPSRAGQPTGGTRRRRRLRRWLMPVWALVLSLEKRGKLRRAWKARNRGMIVVCDRYPQNEVFGINDGPLLSHWRDRRSRILRALAVWEGAPYEWAERNPPDLVVRLDVSEPVALERDPTMDPDTVRRRVEVVRSLRFGGETEILPVDADAPLEQVILDVKRRVWSRL